MKPSTRHIKALITSILAVLAIAVTVPPETQPTQANINSPNQRLTLEMIRKVAIVSRELL